MKKERTEILLVSRIGKNAVSDVVPLPTVGDTPAAEAWAGFLRRREALVARMELDTCNGCDRCGLRCMDGITVTRAEWETVQAFLASMPKQEVERVQAQAKTVPWPGAEDTGATVTFCAFRDMERNNCSVYSARPTVCRLLGHTPWLPCPIGAVTQVPEGSPELWSAYRSFERRTFAEWRTDAGEDH